MKKRTIAEIIGSALLLAAGLVGIYNVDRITDLDLKRTKLNKNVNIVLAIFGGLTCVGAFLTAKIVDKELLPEVETFEEESTEE
jgi:hypothetical protein